VRERVDELSIIQKDEDVRLKHVTVLMLCIPMLLDVTSWMMLTGICISDSVSSSRLAARVSTYIQHTFNRTA
jgi:hypothetical protein